MSHALIIDDNMIVSRAVQRRLETLGFTSFDHTWTEEQAMQAAHCRPPDLVIIGDNLESGSILAAAERISENHHVPVLMVTGNPLHTRALVERRVSFEGPFLFNEIEEAVQLANAAIRGVHPAPSGLSLENEGCTQNGKPSPPWSRQR